VRLDHLLSRETSKDLLDRRSKPNRLNGVEMLDDGRKRFLSLFSCQEPYLGL
jgi:hypothetical protein